MTVKSLLSSPAAHQLVTVPLDAWAITEYDSKGARQSVRTEDTCGASPDDPRTGSVQPGERRELGVLERADINDRRSRRFELRWCCSATAASKDPARSTTGFASRAPRAAAANPMTLPFALCPLPFALCP